MNALSQHPPSVRTTCPYCGVGCGVLAKPDGHGGAEISGDPEHPANFGRLCSKGSALGETLGLTTRLLHPMLRGADDRLKPVSWETALDHVAGGLRQTIQTYGPDAVAFYLSGQLLTEDYYVANKLMKGFIGSANVDTNSRLCMASSVAGHRRAFGSDTVPGVYEDLDHADLIILVGSNTAWCHPVLFQRMMRNRQDRGAKLVVIDPRRTATADDADLFLPVAPGTDAVLFSGLLVHLAERNACDVDYITRHTTDFETALERAREIAPDVETAAAACGLESRDVQKLFDWFCGTPKVVTCFSQGVNQSAQGTDKVNAIINCHLATGRIGRLGQGPFSLTGQPNAMGGREVGGLANQLAAHMGFSPEEIDRVGRFWRASNMAQHEGHKAVQMFEAIARGEIKALWVMGTNPVVSLPDAGAMREALGKLDLFVVSENVLSNDTVNSGAHVLLPAAAWGEKDGTVTNSERRISRQRPFLALPGEARPDWWAVAEVAQRLGFADAFAYRHAADIFREHAALSAFENDGVRDFDIGALAAIGDERYNALDPLQWPASASGQGRERFFADGGFYTADRKARFIAVEPPRLRQSTSTRYPLRLNTGRVRDQWHTMTRSGLSPRLGSHLPEPFVEVHPADAAAAGLEQDGFARITTPYGICTLKVAVDDGQQCGSIFVPIHWNDETAASARVGELVAPETDPFSGQPESKATPATIAPVVFRLRGFLLTRERAVALPPGTLWSRVAIAGGTGFLVASDGDVGAWRDWATASLGDIEFAEYSDPPHDTYRLAAFVEGRLEACLFIGPADDAPRWDSIKALFTADDVSARDRRALLSGRSADGIAESGPLVCACFGVGLATIRDAIASRRVVSVEDIGRALKAGTNCGSCLPELRKIVARDHAEEAA